MLAIKAILFIAMALNFFDMKGGLKMDVSPRALLTGDQLDMKRHLRLQIGEYCQVHENEKPRNSPKARTHPALYLGPGNEQGNYDFLSLQTGKKIG